MNRRVAVRGIIMRDGKLFAVRQKQYDGKAVATNDYWCTPGGGVDVGEPLIPALERELIEEVGVKPAVGPLPYVQQFMHNGTEQMEFFFAVLNPEDYADIDLSATTHGAIEIDQFGFIDPAKEHLLPEFLSTIPLAEDIAKPGAPKFFNYL
ncbi:MAG TPA: NUDIX domain-containing protein [Candidatus Saccharimonadales bacterium]|jgi:ADP-ribose pyrophosphatase YjhB (NUDIX family)